MEQALDQLDWPTRVGAVVHVFETGVMPSEASAHQYGEVLSAAVGELDSIEPNGYGRSPLSQVAGALELPAESVALAREIIRLLNLKARNNGSNEGPKP